MWVLGAYIGGVFHRDDGVGAGFAFLVDRLAAVIQTQNAATMPIHDVSASATPNAP